MGTVACKKRSSDYLLRESFEGSLVLIWLNGVWALESSVEILQIRIVNITFGVFG